MIPSVDMLEHLGGEKRSRNGPVSMNIILSLPSWIVGNTSFLLGWPMFRRYVSLGRVIQILGFDIYIYILSDNDMPIHN